MHGLYLMSLQNVSALRATNCASKQSAISKIALLCAKLGVGRGHMWMMSGVLRTGGAEPMLLES